MTDEIPRELIVDAKPAPGDQSDSGGSGMAGIVVPVMAAGFLAKLVSPLAGAVALGAGVVLFIARRKPREGRTVLRVEGGLLEVGREGHAETLSRLPLDDLLDVTIERERTPASGGAAKERARLSLDRAAPAEPIFVPSERITSLEAQEWLGKVRVFLRKHGWLPKDER